VLHGKNLMIIDVQRVSLSEGDDKFLAFEEFIGSMGVYRHRKKFGISVCIELF